MSIDKIGHEGELIILNYLKSIGAKNIFQADWIAEIDGEYRIIESKHQDIFRPPPFWGTGLPEYQVRARMAFYTATRIKPYLYVVEKSDYDKKENHHLIWSQSFIRLEMGEYKDTQGENRRRIYDISSFDKTYMPFARLNGPKEIA
jgi:hypothetical protein